MNMRWACLLAFCLAACSALPRTSVIVRIEADEEVRRSLASLSISVYARENERWVERWLSPGVDQARLVWPVELALEPDTGRDGRFEVVVSAWDAGGRNLLETRATSYFVADRTRLLPLTLAAGCLGVGPCADETCRGETCATCRTTDHKASCVESGITSPSDHAPWQEAPALDLPRRYSVAALGDACTTPGERACAGHGSKASLICDGRSFVLRAQCEADEVCDSRLGTTLGDCGLVCAAGMRDESTCVGTHGLRCSVDGVRSQLDCSAGFQCSIAANDVHCADRDECATWPPPCGPGTCTNLDGGYRCDCPDGFAGTGTRACEDIAECSARDESGKGPCWPGLCSELAPGYACLCQVGHLFVNGACQDQDECAWEGACAICENTQGSSLCTCGDGSTCAGETPCSTYDDGSAFCDGRSANFPMPNTTRELPWGRPEDETVTGLAWAGQYADDYEGMRAGCAALGNGYRMPSLLEAVTRLRNHELSTAPEPTRMIWTHTRSPDGQQVFVLDQRDGTVQRVDVRTAYGSTSCVRRATSLTKPAAPERTTHTVAFAATGLRFTRVSSEALDYHAAATYCDTLSSDGFDDYRLPSARELYTLIDAGARDGAWLSAQDFPALAAGFGLWSQTRRLGEDRYVMRTDTLELATQEPTAAARALCVRFQAPEAP